MPDSYIAKKNLIFVSIAALGFGYIAFLITSFYKVFSGCAMQIILLAQSLSEAEGNAQKLLSSPKFLFQIFAGIVLVLLWMKVVLAFFYFIKRVFKTNEFIKTLHIVKTRQNFSVLVFESSQHLVFTAGFLRPKIYISDLLLNKTNKDNMNTILLHEYFHRYQLDPLKNMIVDFLQRIFPTFPFKGSLFQSYKVLVELACDEYVEQKLQSKVPVIESLYSILSMQVNGSAPFLTAQFADQMNRISILVGRSTFETKKLFLSIISATILFTGIALFVFRSSVFAACPHLDKCFSALFDNEVSVQAHDSACEEHLSDSSLIKYFPDYKQY